MTPGTLAGTWLRRTWWFLCPSFAVLTIRLTVERACAEPYDLLPALTSQPGWAWPLAVVYVLAHVWVVAAYLVTVSSAQTVLPPLGVWRAAWGTHLVKVALMLALFAIEYSPVPMWRAVGAALGCRSFVSGLW